MPDAALALTERLRRAAVARGRLVPRGAGRWWTDRAAGEALECAGLSAEVRLDAADLVATAGAAVTLDHLDRTLGAQGVFLALDPPGSAARTLGGVLAAGGAGPLAAGFGGPRDQVLGLTFAAGNGQLVKTGGKVVKNVAGFDLAKLVIGGHGAFGIITEVNLRLRARPAGDRTRAFLLDGPGAAERALAAGQAGAACELLSPSMAGALGGPARWTLAIRALGTEDGVTEELEAVAAALGRGGGDRADAGLWAGWRREVGAWPVLLRIGADPGALGPAVALAQDLPSVIGVSATVPRGTVRVGCTQLTAADARALRERCAARRWPVTLERADAATRAAVGVWGAMPAGALELARALRRVFDPDGVFDVPLWADGKTGSGEDGKAE